MKVALIVAVDHQLGIGYKGDLLWGKIPSDMKRFKELTTSLPIIMGRKTYESIGKPLPHRYNIVVSTTMKDTPGIKVVSSFEDAIIAAENYCEQFEAPKVMVIGGNSIYTKAFPYADELHITWVQSEFEVDTYFPEWNGNHWKRVIEINAQNKTEPIKTVYQFLTRTVTYH